MTNSFAVVGSRAASFSSACFVDRKYFHLTIRGFTCKIMIIDDINYFPVGTAVAACRIFPINSSISLNGTPFVMRNILRSSAPITLTLSCASCAINHPTITSFLTAHLSLPESNFFLEIGSYPLRPDNCGSGNTLWIPCSKYLDK